MLVSDWLTHSLTHCRLVNLIDVTLACEDGNSKLVEVVTVVEVDDEKRVDNSLVQIWKVNFGHKVKFLFGLWLKAKKIPVADRKKKKDDTDGEASLPPSLQARGRKGKGDKEKEKGDKDKGEEREKKKRKIRLEMHNDQVINVMVKLVDKNDEQRLKKKTGSVLTGLLWAVQWDLWNKFALGRTGGTPLRVRES